MMMPITYANNFLQYDKSIIAFQENEKKITYGYVEETVEKDFHICSTIHCFNECIQDSEEECYFEVTTTQIWCYIVCSKSVINKMANNGYSLITNILTGCINEIKPLYVRKATVLEAYMLIKDNDSGMIDASEEIKKIVHEKFREMLAPSCKMFILGHNDNESLINMIPKDVIFEIIKISNQ